MSHPTWLSTRARLLYAQNHWLIGRLSNAHSKAWNSCEFARAERISRIGKKADQRTLRRRQQLDVTPYELYLESLQEAKK